MEAGKNDELNIPTARIAVSTLFFADGCALGGWAPHIPDVQLRLNLNYQTLGFVLLASAIGAITTMPMAGALIHRFGSNRSSIFFALILCATIPLLLTHGTLPLLVVNLYFMGAFNGQLDVSMNAHAVEVQNRYQRPMLSATHGWFSIGGFAGGLGAYAAAKLGVPPVTHLCVASVILATAVLTARPKLLPSSVDRNSEGPKYALPQGILLYLGLITLFALIAEGGIWEWASVYLRTVLKSDGGTGALAFGCFSGGMAVGRFLGDRIIEKHGWGPTLRVSGALVGIGLALALTTNLHLVAIIGFTVVGFGVANIVPILFSASASLPGISPGVGLAAVSTLGYTGFLFGPPLIGFAARSVSLAFALGMIAILGVIIACSASLVARYETNAQTKTY